jgi:hypothetical protein
MGDPKSDKHYFFSKIVNNVPSNILGCVPTLTLKCLTMYNGPQNLDSVISYTWEIKGGGPSGTNAKEVSAFI